MMKAKLISVLLVLALALSLTGTAFAVAPAAQTSVQKFELDGRNIGLPAFNIDGHNYVQLRSLAAVLSGTEAQFSVEWDAEANAVKITSGAAYVPGVTDRSPSADAADTAVRSTQTVVIDGEAAKGLSIWNIDGNNYFQLAELKNYLGFGLGYDGNTDTVLLTGNGAEPAVMPPAAGSYAEIYKSLTAGRGAGVATNGAVRGGGDLGVAVEEFADTAEAEPMPMQVPAATASSSANTGSSAAGGGKDYSGTNVQVQGIDEGDIVKTDGEYIYVLNGRYHLTVVKADGEDSAVVSQTAIGTYSYENEGEGDDYSGYSSESKRPREMFVSDGRLVVLSNYYSDRGWYEEAESRWRWENENYSCVDFYDVSDPAAPKLLASLGQDGSILSTRMQGGHIYVVTSYWVWNYDEDDPGTFVPVVYANGAARPIAADCVYICGEGSSRYVVAGDYDIASGALTSVRSLLGSGDEVYMSGDNLYVLGSEWVTETLRTYTESVYTVTEYRNSSNTEIYRFDLTGGGLELAASGKVPGYIDSQFSADEKDGCLRIVTTTDDYRYKIYEDGAYDFRNYKSDGSESSSGLYILDADLGLLGSVTGLAEDEYVYSVRFDGDIAYFCTFRSVDPLFTVDLSAPKNPTVLNALKITGFSDYLHNWTDGKLFGFGREADEETGRTGGLKLVMFDATDKTDVKVENTYQLDDSYSEALYNHKAFFIVPAKNIIGFLSGREYHIFSYDAAAGFRELCSFSFDTREYNVRGLYIEDYAYIVGSEELMVLDMSTWAAPSPVNIMVPSEED